ncbi:RNA polymerase I termination factor-like [Triticum dicoccoides]|uniref:RNA polymerase I termination factor-like n=1 Tax=Triticum dicoccoides TaxID=85692 RepID=UPI00188F33C8|nr:RNA polymerase I termination factor-like [Triticum dicoccoides]
MKKDKKKGKEKKEEKEAGLGRQKQTFDTNAGKEQAEKSGLTAVNSCSERGDRADAEKVKKYRKKKEKKKDKAAETTGQMQAFDTTVENLGSEVYAERIKVKGRQSSSKSKKRKRKRQDGELAANISGADQIVAMAREANKRKKENSVVLKESSQIDNTKKGTSKIGNGSDKEANADGKGDKKKKKRKEGIEGGKREKEKAARSKNKGRRVTFADSVVVFSIEGRDDEEGGSSGGSELVHGQRFTLEEEATLMEAMRDYAEMKQLGEEGLEMIRRCRKYPELKGCWSDIGKSLPHRPHEAIYKRARILLTRSDERKWTQEEYHKIRQFVEKNGTDWKTLSEELGKSEIHVKDTWRRIKPKNLKKGRWTQDEHQNLFDLVNLDLRLKAHQEKNPGHRKLRDNISWEAISDKLTSRNHKNCCLKWYVTLASPLVKQGVWADIDDYRLVEALQKVDAVCIEDVDWESLLGHRSGEVCRQRWNQMVRGIGSHRQKTFIEQVEVLSKRYCPEMIDYRESEN